ncbi:ABC transporter ATP-binding protein [Halomonas halocynthiae]|uniref:ABC transporter ATP-binding protein n=1 Tax=Halomonas halocynthiae TaxID=176290 RepID=UPI0004297DB1|nr:ABC transporter ATP-binding protein [Halomonas halocynthiae]
MSKARVILSVEQLSKQYSGGFQALDDINLDIRRGEIFALLGPNGAGKTTLIGVICGLVNASSGRVLVDGHDNISEFRQARQRIGLVPQELTSEAFSKVWDTVSFSRGLFGKPPNPEHIERVLRSLSLWEKRNNRLITLSGGMKRRVLIAKALSHEPDILFLDEPSAGVDVELRRDMWAVVRGLRDRGVTIILTTHYIEEAEEMADRIGVIRGGKLMLVEDKHTLMSKLGTKVLTLRLMAPLTTLPESLNDFDLSLSEDGFTLDYGYRSTVSQPSDTPNNIAALLAALAEADIEISDMDTRQSSLEDIFISLVKEQP